MSDRLTAATVSYRDAKETFEVHRDVWQKLVVDAVDDGLSVKAVASMLQLSTSRVHAIIARVYAADSI